MRFLRQWIRHRSVIEACRKLKARGYQLALDDFVWEPKFEPLLQLADYIKVDFVLSGAGGAGQALPSACAGARSPCWQRRWRRRRSISRPKRRGLHALSRLLFLLPGADAEPKDSRQPDHSFRDLQLLQSDDIDLEKGTKLIKRNPSLTYRLLRLVNSPTYAIRTEIHSVKEALRMVGETASRHTVMLAIASDLNGKQPLEVLCMALLRARFCELASVRYGLKSCEQFLLERQACCRR